MNSLKLLKKLYIRSQLYVSFCATFLGLFILQEQQSYQFWSIVVLFLTFWNGYFFTVFHKKKDAIFWNLVGFVVISFIIFKFLNSIFYIKWLVVLLLGLIYNADFFNINLREFSIIKTFYVGFVWAISLVWLPLNNEISGVLNSSDFIRRFVESTICNFPWEWFLIVFLFISALTFPFEIRDLKRDNFPTLPKKIGIQNTKYLSYIFLFITSILASKNLGFIFAISFYLTVGFASIFVYFSDIKRQDLYYSFGIESLSAFPILIKIILELLFHN